MDSNNSNEAINNDQEERNWTRDELRSYFKESGLDYRYLDGTTISLLNAFIGVEICQAHIDDVTDIYWKIPLKPKLRKGCAFLTAIGSYFPSRETVSFNQDGFIGFCGEASDSNLQPIARAFVKWCDYVVKNAVNIVRQQPAQRVVCSRGDE